MIKFIKSYSNLVSIILEVFNKYPTFCMINTLVHVRIILVFMQ